MDNLTHSLVGALLGQCGLKSRTGLAMPALVIGANIPDVDAACLFWVEGVEHLAIRRGITHGPPAMVLLPLMLAGALWGWDRWQERRGTRPAGRAPVHFGWLFALSFIGCLSHPLLDWMNVYGVRLLEPFSQRWFYGDVLFIVDPWLWALLIGSVWLSLRRERRGGAWQRPARAAFAAMLAYVGANAAITWYRGAISSSDAPYHSVNIASPPPLAFWRREIITGNDDGLWRVEGREIGNCTLTQADKRRIARAVPDAAPFLFWSRAPFISVEPDGRTMLRDARYASPAIGDRFAVELPTGACGAEPEVADRD